MDEQGNGALNRPILMNTLAVVGFVALIGGSMWLAVYSTQYVPSVVNRIGSAAVYLGSVFIPTPEPTLSVVSTPIASTTIPFGTAKSTIDTSATTATTPTQSQQKTASTADQKTTATIQIDDAPATVTRYGLPDLAITISAIGYLETNSTDSFVASSTVPTGKQPAVQFSVENKGTNMSGPWQISTDPRLANSVETQSPLAPGNRASYVIYVDRTNRSIQLLTITVSDNFMELDTTNDSISLTFTLN